MSKRYGRRPRNPDLPEAAFNAPVAKTLNVQDVAGGGLIQKALNWKEEYGEVLGDLRKTAVIAVILVAIMVGLSFVI